MTERSACGSEAAIGGEGIGVLGPMKAVPSPGAFDELGAPKDTSPSPSPSPSKVAPRPLKDTSLCPSPSKGPPRSAPPTLMRANTLGPSAASLEKERLEQPSAMSRVFNPPKLERKHSSGDLHSRLKTRKILGVGETDNGDIHRSKISQVLGHNEHLYVRLPRGFWTAHVIVGAEVTVEAVLLLLAPTIAVTLGLTPYLVEGAIPASRMAGAALAGLCVFVWSLLGTSDKHYARTMLLSMITYHILATCVSCAACFAEEDPNAVDEYRLVLVVVVRTALCLLCIAYFYSIAGYTPIRGQRPSGYQQSCHGLKDH